MKPFNSNKNLHTCVDIGALQCFLQMFYASNFRHACMVPTPFMVFECAYQFAYEKSTSCHKQISNLIYCNSNCQRCIILNNQNLDRMLSNNNIKHFLFISCVDRPLGVHISGMFLQDHLCTLGLIFVSGFSFLLNILFG